MEKRRKQGNSLDGRQKARNIRFKAYVTLAVFVLLIGTCVFKCVKNDDERAELRNSKDYVKARVTSEKSYLPNSPVSHEYSYYYQFELNGVLYKGSGASPSLAIGDSILVRYLKTDPSFSQPASWR